jgi:hypothetical protein
VTREFQKRPNLPELAVAIRIVGIVVLALSAYGSSAFAKTENDGGTPSGVFLQGGSGECDLDCSVALSRIQAQVLKEADTRCQESSARQVSEWNVHIHGYGRIQVSAAFLCE